MFLLPACLAVWISLLLFGWFGFCLSGVCSIVCLAECFVFMSVICMFLFYVWMFLCGCSDFFVLFVCYDLRFYVCKFVSPYPPKAGRSQPPDCLSVSIYIIYILCTLYIYPRSLVAQEVVLDPALGQEVFQDLATRLEDAEMGLGKAPGSPGSSGCLPRPSLSRLTSSPPFFSLPSA